jgi:uncharacterized membrane protein YcaP (DUF421 family)
MDTIARTAFIYLFLLVLLRLAGKRTMAQITIFDFLLLLLISEAVQQSMVGNDASLLGGVLAAITLVGMETLLSLTKLKNKAIDRLLEGEPVIIVENGKPIRSRMAKERVDDEEILEAARRLQGIERMSQIKYAILEKSGGISIIPRDQALVTPLTSVPIEINENEVSEDEEDKKELTNSEKDDKDEKSHVEKSSAQ